MPMQLFELHCIFRFFRGLADAAESLCVSQPTPRAQISLLPLQADEAVGIKRPLGIGPPFHQH